MTWKGKNQLGQEVSNGVYFVKLSTQGDNNLQKMGNAYNYPHLI